MHETSKTTPGRRGVEKGKPSDVFHVVDYATCGDRITCSNMLKHSEIDPSQRRTDNGWALMMYSHPKQRLTVHDGSRLIGSPLGIRTLVSSLASFSRSHLHFIPFTSILDHHAIHFYDYIICGRWYYFCSPYPIEVRGFVSSHSAAQPCCCWWICTILAPENDNPYYPDSLSHSTWSPRSDSGLYAGGLPVPVSGEHRNDGQHRTFTNYLV